MNLKPMAVKSTWFDLLTSNMADTRSFYEGLFGWQFLRLSDSALPDYWVIQAGEELIGGLRKASAETQSQNSSVLYFTVPNLESSAQRVKELGGQLVGERVDLGKNRGSYQWFRDREGNMAALWAAQKESI